jgi:hypothetical protein
MIRPQRDSTFCGGRISAWSWSAVGETALAIPADPPRSARSRPGGGQGEGQISVATVTVAGHSRGRIAVRAYRRHRCRCRVARRCCSPRDVRRRSDPRSAVPGICRDTHFGPVLRIRIRLPPRGLVRDRRVSQQSHWCDCIAFRVGSFCRFLLGSLRAPDRVADDSCVTAVKLSQFAPDRKPPQSIQPCAICGKAMDPRERGNYHIIKRATGEKKHAHPECVTGDPAKARAEGFLHEDR